MISNIEFDVKASASWRNDRWVYQMQDTHQWYTEGETYEKRGQQRENQMYYGLSTEAYRIAYVLLMMDAITPGQKA